jgi:hypothetical protein
MNVQKSLFLIIVAMWMPGCHCADDPVMRTVVLEKRYVPSTTRLVTVTMPGPISGLTRTDTHQIFVSEAWGVRVWETYVSGRAGERWVETSRECHALTHIGDISRGPFTCDPMPL